MSPFLFLDCETTGLPSRRGLAFGDVEGWPRLVQLAWAFYDEAGNAGEADSRIVRPEGFVIPPEAAAVHHISHDQAVRDGRPALEVLSAFVRAVEDPVEAVVAHNLDFDLGVLGAELARGRVTSRLFEHRRVCTMKATTTLLRLPGPYGFKWPKLEELHVFLFGSAYEGGHDAALDAAACARCFFELRRRRFDFFSGRMD